MRVFPIICFLVGALYALAYNPAHADSVARLGDDWVRFTALPCLHESVIALLTADKEDPLDYRKASASFRGKEFAACWKPDFDSRRVLLRYEDGDGGLVPMSEIKDDSGAGI
jgi:hypothetical protein